jgi:hypothetical protein
MNKVRNFLRSKTVKVAALAAPVVATASGAFADGSTLDYTVAASGIKADVLATLPITLPIFALVFGVLVIKSFFKRSTH